MRFHFFWTANFKIKKENKSFYGDTEIECILKACKWILENNSGYRYSEEEKNTYLWRKLGKWKIIMPSVLLLFIFLSNLVPSREHFAYIIATPYVVESGKSIVDSLQDPNSKLSKLNQMTDKALDKALIYLGENENDKQNKN